MQLCCVLEFWNSYINISSKLVFVGGSTWQYKFQFSGRLIFVGAPLTKIKKLMPELRYMLNLKCVCVCVCGGGGGAYLYSPT